MIPARRVFAPPGRETHQRAYLPGGRWRAILPPPGNRGDFADARVFCRARPSRWGASRLSSPVMPQVLRTVDRARWVLSLYIWELNDEYDKVVHRLTRSMCEPLASARCAQLISCLPSLRTVPPGPAQHKPACIPIVSCHRRRIPKLLLQIDPAATEQLLDDTCMTHHIKCIGPCPSYHTAPPSFARHVSPSKFSLVGAASPSLYNNNTNTTSFRAVVLLAAGESASHAVQRYRA